MSNVKSTYNFVTAPSEQEVFCPDWGEQISHDIPFSDGESGEIELKITAQTPIFIRNGHAKNHDETEFSHVLDQEGNKQYFIPGSSLKGMIRNVLEIMSFSRLNPKLVNDHRYAFRDLTRGSEYMNSYQTNKVCAGWLKQSEDGQWYINECDFLHIHQKEVDSLLNTNFSEIFKNPIKDTSVTFKYHLVDYNNLTHRFRKVAGKNKDLAVASTEGDEGTIVFTGQSSPRKEIDGKRPSGKVHEFVLFKKLQGKFKLSEKQIEDFKFIYADHDKNNISKAWKFWRDKLDNDEAIPVFFNKDGNRIKHFGLAYMYKLPYENSIHEMLPFANYKPGIDLAHALFGYTQYGEENTTLKGRVMFGHAFSENATASTSLVKEILGGPKASYFPFYLDKSLGKKAYQKKGSLKGFKRYPVHNSVKTGQYSSDQLKNEKVFSTIRPLNSGTEFNCKIRFHNLKPVELGALVAALSFHNNSNSYFHSLGGAKALGYGKVKIEIPNISKFLEHLQFFESEMNAFLKQNWVEHKNIIELFAMASNPDAATEKNLTYPKMDAKSTNEFIEYKNKNLHLENYAKLLDHNINIPSVLNTEFNTKKKELEAKKLEEQHQWETEIIENYQALIEEAETYLNDNKFDKSKAAYHKAIDYSKQYKFISDITFINFLSTIETGEKNYREQTAYENAIKLATKDAFENFLKQYPISDYKLEIEDELRKLNAVSGIPENILNKDNFKQFGNNSDNWVKKLTKAGETIESLGLLEEHKALLLKIAVNDNKKKIKDYQKKLEYWYGKAMAEEIIKIIFG